MRGTPNEVAQREIRIRQQACNKNDCALCGLDHAVDLFQSSAKGKVVIVTNSKKKSFVFVDSLVKKIDKANLLLPVDVLHIHGSLLKQKISGAFGCYVTLPPTTSALPTFVAWLAPTQSTLASMTISFS